MRPYIVVLIFLLCSTLGSAKKRSVDDTELVNVDNSYRSKLVKQTDNDAKLYKIQPKRNSQEETITEDEEPPKKLIRKMNSSSSQRSQLRNVDRAEKRIKKRKPAIQDEDSQSNLDQTEVSTTEKVVDPVQSEPTSAVSSESAILDDDNMSHEEEKSDAASTFGDVLSSPLQTQINPTTKIPVSSLSLSFQITKVMPISIMLRVNVTTDASVWCGAWRDGENKNLQYLQMNSLGKFVHKSRYILLTGLTPSTTYDITCTGLSDGGYMIEDPNQIHQVVRTTDAEFHIEKAILKDQKVEVTLRSNLEIPVLCLLFNNKGLKIESKVYDSTKAQSVSFIVSSMKHDYRVQCNAFNNDNKVFASTQSALVQRVRATWIRRLFVVLSLVMILIVIVSVIVWRRRNIPRPVYEMDDDEIVTLLKKTQSNQLLRSPLDDDSEALSPIPIDRMVRCNKCGFTNPPSSTVCRDCNSLLQGNNYFTSLSRKVY